MSLQVGDTAPNLQLPDLEGTLHNLIQPDRAVTILNFWSADCPACERVDKVLLPRLTTWDNQVTLIAIAPNTNESDHLIREIARQRGIPLVLLDRQLEAARLYNAQITPEFFVIDQAGVLRYHGAFDDVSFRRQTPTRFYLFEVIEALLNNQPPPFSQTSPYGCAIVRYSAT
ncbi:MAG: redoxin domain-containing protein [Anaerolineales bacterium]|jgi:peroxiredoxin